MAILKKYLRLLLRQYMLLQTVTLKAGFTLQVVQLQEQDFTEWE